MPRTMVEYATDQITIYRFCPYQCRYCWAWRNKLFASRIQRGRYDPLEEARKYVRIKDPRIIVVSFTSDPYPPVEKKNRLTRRVLEVLSEAKQHRSLVLTKNPILALRDFTIMKKHGDVWLGTTLISVDKTELEPKAPKPSDRRLALYLAKKRGVKTWLSIEPIIPQITDLVEIIERTLDYVDYYVLGSFNYTKILGFEITEDEKKAWYQKQVPKAISLLKSYGKRFFIKKELRRYLEL